MIYRLKLSMITFDLLLEQYPKCYKGKYNRGVSMPNADDSMRVIHSEDSLTYYKRKMIERYGDIAIELNEQKEVWFDRVRIIDEKFLEDKSKFCDAKARAMDRWVKEGFNTD